jgi:penicillin-binding protein 1A
MGFNDNRVTMRSEYWGQGAHNALFIVGDFLQQSFRAKALDSKARFGVPKDASKAVPPGMFDALWGRANAWWSSVFPDSSGTAAVAQPTPVPALPAPPPMPEPAVIAEPLRLPDSGALPPQQPFSRPPDAVLGAPAPRVPDAVIPAPQPLPPTNVDMAPAHALRPPPQAGRAPMASGSATGDVILPQPPREDRESVTQPAEPAAPAPLPAATGDASSPGSEPAASSTPAAPATQ